MPLVVVLVIVFGLLVFMWYGIGGEGPRSRRCRARVRAPWDELDFALLYDLGLLRRHGDLPPGRRCDHAAHRTRRHIRYGGAIAAAGLSFALLVNSPYWALAGFAAAGAGFSSIIPLAFAAGGRIPELSEGAGVATVSGIGYLGFLVGPPAIGFDPTDLRCALDCSDRAAQRYTCRRNGQPGSPRRR